VKRKRRSPEAEFLTLALKGDAPGETAGLAEAARKVKDWSTVAELASIHRIAPWLLKAMQKAGVDACPPSFIKDLKATAWSQSIFTMALGHALEEALTALGQAEVPVMVLKGPVVAERLYPDPGLRPYTDIDILVPYERQTDIQVVCQALGYVLEEDHGGLAAPRSGTSEHAFEMLYVHPERQVKLDVHLDHLQIGLRPQDTSGLWQRSDEWSFGSACGRAPSQEDLFLTLAVHLHRHGFNRLIWIKDLDLFLRRFGAELDWKGLEQMAAAEGVSSSLRLSLRITVRLLDTPLPPGARHLARASPASFLASILWPDEGLFRTEPRSDRWRRAVQFVPWEGIRGALPSLLLMGRRGDKVRALWRRLHTRNGRR